MASPELTLGILAPTELDREVLRSQVNAIGWVTVVVEVDQYCAASGDRATRRFVETRPEIIIVDMEDPPAAVKALEILHDALPETWLFANSEKKDPQLIIETMRAGAREYLFKPIPPRSLSQALGRYLTEKQRSRQKKDAGKIYVVTAAKGGSGATSLTINIATALMEVPDTRVALIDLNSPVGDAAAYLNLGSQYTVSDALGAASRLDPVLLESFMSDAQGLAVLPGPREFWPELAPGVTTAPGVSALAKVLEVVAQTYTHAIVDLNSSLDKHQLQAVMEMATGVVVVLTPELPALWRTQRLFAFLGACGGTEKLQLVINRARRGDEITESEIEKALNHPVFWKLPNNYGACIEAINSGNPLVSNNHSDLSASYRKLAYRLTGISLPKKQRTFLRLFSRSSDA
jgi:pilus assembly protein CpaE